MYKPSLLNFFPSISSQLQTLRDKKKQILVRTCFKRGGLPKSRPLDFTT